MTAAEKALDMTKEEKAAMARVAADIVEKDLPLEYQDREFVRWEGYTKLSEWKRPDADQCPIGSVYNGRRIRITP